MKVRSSKSETVVNFFNPKMIGILKNIFLVILLQPCCPSQVSTLTAADKVATKCQNEEINTLFLPGCNCTIKDMKDLSKTNLDIKFIEKNCNYTKTIKEMKIVSNFRSIDPTLFQKLLHIEHLYARNDNFTSINITTYNLKIIDLSNNNMKDLYVEFMKSMMNLNVSYNKLKFIKMNTSDKHSDLNLEILDISFNNISKLQSFLNFPKLKDLNMSHNSISIIPSGFFQKYPNLIYLDLSHNKLRTLSLDSFHGLSELKSFYVSFNNLNKLDVHVFHPLGKLQILNLNSNMIGRFNFNGFLEVLPNIRSVEIRENPLNCDYLKEMEEKFESLGKILTISAECPTAGNPDGHCCISKPKLPITQSTISHLKITINKNSMIHPVETLHPIFTPPPPVQTKNQPNDKKNMSSLKHFMEKLHQQNAENVKKFLNFTMDDIDSKMDAMNCRYEHILEYLKCIVFLIIILMVPIFIKMAIAAKERLYNGKNKKDFLPLVTYHE